MGISADSFPASAGLLFDVQIGTPVLPWEARANTGGIGIIKPIADIMDNERLVTVLTKGRIATSSFLSGMQHPMLEQFSVTEKAPAAQLLQGRPRAALDLRFLDE